ncbi:hypothetical protein ELI38_20820 [Rhizobium leguminosarum]|uniref:hypothetical protein n=1 Tax=Rhizobium leguminosarum TaxID=384 RepID=UPI000A5351C1|nr:hypothetical protein [Rhizobium leguminosarum]NKK92089.1 hypothetical protein [Rhizobium leguminosarum bv. viciae]TAU98244.1 hypothetical protein ELI38_20820 [Rhizobium leguminosarum]TAW53876.1 hypothetical protein ELI14_22515 [Rhizobium leguminosarum]TBE56584.1 hypothetical protein ELH04_20170 [Rhizobium leguminosarum]TBZ53755.1 hypothetical protein E0H44_02380 [Rhizobium leguminosarum bv. viciae]
MATRHAKFVGKVAQRFLYVSVFFLWVIASFLAVLQLGTPPAGLAWIPIAGFFLSIVATVIGKRQASTTLP